MGDDLLLVHCTVLRGEPLNLSQTQIARRLGITRGEVCRFLRAADDLGLFGGRRVLSDEQRAYVARLRPMFRKVFDELEVHDCD